MFNLTRSQYERRILKGKKISEYTWEFVRAAEELKLKYRFITHQSIEIERHLEISHRKKIMRILPATTPFNNLVAYDISIMKHLTSSLLKEKGLPVPRQVIVKNPDDHAILSLVYPLVVKPLFLSGGKGISANIKNPAELARAIRTAQRATNQNNPESIKKNKVIVEELIPGEENRLLIFKNQLIAAVQRIPASLVADGKHTIEDLIDINNNRRGAARRVYDIVIDYDLHNCLRQQKLKLSSIPPKNQIIKLHTVSNASKGGTTRNITEDVHPGFKKIAIEAAKIIDLVLAGIDIMAEDITQDPSGQSHGIIEVNSRAGVLMHCHPNVGRPVDVPKILIKSYFGLK